MSAKGWDLAPGLGSTSTDLPLGLPGCVHRAGERGVEPEDDQLALGRDEGIRSVGEAKAWWDVDAAELMLDVRVVELRYEGLRPRLGRVGRDVVEVLPAREGGSLGSRLGAKMGLGSDSCIAVNTSVAQSHIRPSGESHGSDSPMPSPPVALLALLVAHVESIVDGCGHVADVPRIDEHGPGPQGLSGTSKLREDEDPGAVALARDVLERDKVHAVAEGGHKSDVRDSVEGDELVEGLRWGAGGSSRVRRQGP